MTTNTRPAPRRAPKPIEKAPEEEIPSTSEQLAEEVVAEIEDYPPGTPEFRRVLQLRRRDRATYYRAADAANLVIRQRAKKPKGDDSDITTEIDGESVKINLGDFADYNDLLAMIEDVLAVVAVDKDAFEAWVTEVGDTDLIAVFNLYQRKSQPGEAESSSS
jgi:hypothetical protein